MILISENLHIISKSTKQAILDRNDTYIVDLLKRQLSTNPDFVDLNIGPAKGVFAGTMKWLVDIFSDLSDVPISFDSSNIREIELGLSIVKNPQNCIINSTSADEEKLDKITDLANEYNCSLIALTMNSEIGIPKDADTRLELAFEINAMTESKQIPNSKVFFDPLLLPICVEQSQALVALNTIRMLKESFEPKVMTTIGLSNLSNGCDKNQKELINRVFLVMAMGCGLDSAIADSFDNELLRVVDVIENNNPMKPSDNLLIELYKAMQNFDDIDSIEYDISDSEQSAIYKTAEIILNKKVYTNSYLEI